MSFGQTDIAVAVLAHMHCKLKLNNGYEKLMVTLKVW
jgi:hypothetical protein